MGKIVKLECPTCKHYEEITLNNLSTNNELGQLLSQLSDDNYNTIKKWLKENEIKSHKSLVYLTYCPLCRKLEAAQALEIISSQGDKKTFGLVCDKCHNERDVINMDEYIPCPECESKMKIIEVGFL